MLPGAVLAAVWVLAVACGGSDGAAPQETPPAAAATSAASTASTVALRTSDGLTLDARLFEAEAAAERLPRQLVVLQHMYPADQSHWFETAALLQRRGYSVLTLDFRGYGRSEGPRDGGVIDRDVHAALRYAAEAGYRSVALVGASMGGTASIVVAADPPPAPAINGVFTLSAPEEFRGLDAAGAVGRMAVPLWVVAAEGDTAAAHALAGFAEQPVTDRAELVPGRAHGTDLLAAAEGDRVRELLLAFLASLRAG